MIEKRVKLYELLAANQLDRKDKARQWYLAGMLEKVFIPGGLTGEKLNDQARFQARGKRKSW